MITKPLVLVFSGKINKIKHIQVKVNLQESKDKGTILLIVRNRQSTTFKRIITGSLICKTYTGSWKTSLYHQRGMHPEEQGRLLTKHLYSQKFSSKVTWNVTELSRGSHYSTQNIANSTDLSTLKWSILCYVNFQLVK